MTNTDSSSSVTNRVFPYLAVLVKKRKGNNGLENIVTLCDVKLVIKTFFYRQHLVKI